MTRRYWNINLEEMMEARVHFDRATSKWSPSTHHTIFDLGDGSKIKFWDDVWCEELRLKEAF